MNKIIQAFSFIYLICIIQTLVAQNNNERPDAGQLIYSPSENVPAVEIEQAIDNKTRQDIKNKNILTPAASSKNTAHTNTINTNPANSKSISSQTSTTDPKYSIDKSGNQVIYYSPEEKIKMENEVQVEPVNTEQTIYPDLQVIAIKEEIIPVQNFGTERIPNASNSSLKKQTPETEQQKNPTVVSSKIGKVEFLKQYVEELKILIEKNKNVPGYPLQEKQKELEEIENLLKQQ